MKGRYFRLTTDRNSRENGMEEFTDADDQVMAEWYEYIMIRAILGDCALLVFVRQREIIFGS